MSNVIGAVFARGGSLGVPDKNLRELEGKPLVARAVEQALGLGPVSLPRDDRGTRRPEHHQRRDEQGRDHADLDSERHPEPHRGE